MNHFSISQLAQLSGIKPHTIRIWEQRYQALQPNRSEGNTRYYDDTQLRRLLNIVSLANADHKISELCALPDKKLFELVHQYAQNQIPQDKATEYFISQLIAAGMEYDEAGFDKLFSHCLLQFGLKETYRIIIYPMLVRIGWMWCSDSIPPAQEHFISNLLRQKLSTAIDALPLPSSSEQWLLFLPENEFHEIGLLFAHYLVRLSGRTAIYLGANVPLPSLTTAAKDTGAQRLLLFFVHKNLPEDVQNYIDQLAASFPKKEMYIAGLPPTPIQVKLRKNMHLLQSPQDLEQQLNH